MRAIISASESLSLWYHNFKEAVDVKSWNQSELSLNCFHTAFLKIKNKKTINNKSIVIFYFLFFTIFSTAVERWPIKIYASCVILTVVKKERFFKFYVPSLKKI